MQVLVVSGSPPGFSSKESEPTQPNQLLPLYWAQVKDRKNDIEIPLTILSESSDDLEAVAVFFEPVLPFGQLKHLLIGQLSQKKRVTAVLVPDRPYPTMFAARAEFRKNGRSCSCPLANLAISLASLMQPLSCSHRKQVARALWEQMVEWPRASVILPRELARAKAKELRLFTVGGSQDSSLAAAFIAPSSHLLFKWSNLEEAATIRFDIQTDDVMLLSHANEFLLSKKM